MNDHERARIQMLDIDHKRMNRMLWRKHPVFALRVAMAGRFTVEEFWLPMASSVGLCVAHGGCTTAVITRSEPPS